MKYKLSPKLEEFAHRVASIPGMKSLLKPLYYPYKESLIRKQNEQVRKYAYSVMEDFDKALSSIGINYSVAFGTLLGAVRDKGFIAHDLDLDTLVWYEDYTPDIRKALESYGFKLSHVYMLDNGKKGLEETYEKNEVAVDIFYFYPPIDKYPYTCLWNFVEGTSNIEESMRRHGYVEVGRLELPCSRETQRVQFGPIQVPALVNYAEFLASRYGPDYMIPDSSWQPSDEDSCFVKWPGEKAVYQKF